ncbi:MAG: pseudouridine synthase [Mangrovibacterium sp.]
MREQHNRGKAPKNRFGSKKDGRQSTTYSRNSGEHREYKKPYDRKESDYDERGKSFERKSFKRDDERPYAKKNFKYNEDKPFAKKPFRKDERKPFPKKRFSGDWEHQERTSEKREQWKENKKSFQKGFKKRGEDKPVDNTLRLNRFISNAGVCSRRDADKLITDGEISVNGEIITELGHRVNPYDKVLHNGKRITAEQKVYLLLNKPKGFVTSLDDPHADKTVMDLVRNACKERIYPVGRLDKSTTGLLLFTNDGDLAKRLTHPSHQKKKIYHVFLKEKFPEEYLQQIADGIELEDGAIKADAISYVDPLDKSQIGIEIHSGKNRIVRRIFEHFGFRVQRLDRVYFAGLTKKNLPRGRYRFLTPKEVGFLKMS